MRKLCRPLLVSLCLVSFVPATSLAAETKVEADARAALASGKLAQAGLIYLRLGADRSADARYALTLYMRSAKTPAELREAKDLLLIAGGNPEEGGAPAPAAAAESGTTVTTETQLDTGAGTLTQTESTAAGTTSTAVDARKQTLSRSETDASGTRSTNLDARNRAVGYRSESADGKEQVNATASSQGASYEKNVDCTQNPGSEVCKKQTKVGLSEGGLAASYEKTEVKKVSGLQKNPTELRLGATYMTVSTDGADSSPSLFGVSGTAQWALGQLPSASGGKFFGPSLGAHLGASYGSLGGGIDGSMTQLVLNVPFGFQFYNFGEQDPVPLEQSGFGAFVGYTAGLSSTSTSMELDGETIDGGSKGFAHGPSVNVTFPTMNWGTSKLSGFGISGMVLPLETSTIILVSAEWVMGGASPVTPATVASASGI